MGALGAILEDIDQTRGGFSSGPPIGSPGYRLLGLSWSALGRSWGLFLNAIRPRIRGNLVPSRVQSH
eukprot:5968829-Pyramimonas_sp.AAC.1